MARVAFRPHTRLQGLVLLAGLAAATASGIGIGQSMSAAGNDQSLSAARNGQPMSRPHRHHNTITVRSPEGGTMLSVACTAKRHCLAVGDDETLFGPREQLGQWNGGRWRFQARRGSRLAVRDLLNAISCPTTRTCVAVGARYLQGGTVSRPLAQVLTRSRWRIVPVPSPPAHGGSGSKFTGLSCLSVRSCFAVGFNQTRGGATATLAEYWNGVRWRIQRTPNTPHARSNFLTRVSCATVRVCESVGTFVARSGRQFPFAEHWNGVRWRREATAVIRPASGYVLTGVSCPAVRFCMAVGGYAGRDRTLTEVWRGVTWRTRPSPSPAHKLGSNLNDVYCRSPRNCTAIGYSDTTPHRFKTLIEKWNGTRWRIQASPNRRGKVSDLFSVFCPGPRECIAVGNYSDRVGVRRALIETWFGSKWRIAAP
ncbi:MAG TPA: hypothetical protein VEV63_17525 [Streptosporangiaceae bacterium]|nr:hypothetical protein [Streptosporangiaceae bacterium]